MSLSSLVNDLATRVGAEFKTVRTEIAAGGGGGVADPWTYVKLTADEVSTSTSNVATALRFAPEASKLYEVEATLFMRSTVTTTGVRPGIDWPDSNVSQNVAWIMAGSSATAFASRIVGNLTTVNAASTGVAVANEGIYGHMRASFMTSGVPSSDFIVTLASEIAASEVRLAANSWLKYRVIGENGGAYINAVQTTEAAWDALVLAGTTDPNTLYIWPS